ncbi:hypothetical protein P4O66_002201, partial [Electrophorus voltai]
MEAFVSLEIKGRFTFVNKTTKIIIKPPGLLSIIETDKPIYERGQTVNFRIVSLDSNFLTYNQMFPTIEVQDLNSNRIGQWLNVSTFSGFLDMSYPINPEAAEGFYTITAWNERNEPIIQQFEIKEYVLPKFEVTVELPPVITILDTTVTLKVCAKYTYGKPVMGSATAVVCRRSYRYWWFAPGSAQLSDICRTFKMETGRTGCGSYVIDLSDFVLSDTRYVDIISVDAELEEYGTGVVMSGSGSISITSDIVTLTFVNADDVFKPGMAYEGEARYHMEEYSFGYVGMLRRPTYPSAYLWLQPFYSKSSSFLELLRPLVAFSDSDAVVVANYIIHSRALEPQQNSLDFFYMVMSRGHTAQQGCITVEVDPEKENRGKLSILLQSPLSLAPVAQVVVYALLPNGDVLADSMDFPIELSLNEQVNLDQDQVYNMLPIQMLSGYPYGTEDEDPNMCIFRPPIMEPFVNPRSRLPVLPILLGKVNVYNVFKYAGIKIISNAYIKKKEVCRPTGPVPTFDLLLMSSSVAADAGQMQDSGQSQPASSVRKYFPETWIWDLVLVGESGAMEVSKTVPDTITTWEAGAFCTSPVGFGVAPKVNLTAFQPFFVSLTLPYSIVRGEVFTLKATVFNYLPSCIMVKVTLAQSQQFSAQSCVGCVYTHCLCADESWTFMWVITPSVLGEVIIRVSAEAVHSSVLCGNGIPTVPEKGSLDTVEQTLLVVAEGTKQTNSYNEFMCTRGGAVDQTVTLTLPEVFVEGSATAYVSVLGDLMGRALQNLDNLLAMPYGCGEQNMLLFAPDIFILGYLESSGQLTPAIRSKATSFLLSGYQRELSFKHFDGSYSAFGMSDSSGNTWLTAFVMKSFESAKQYIFIDQTVIDQAKTWLGNEQQPNGCFASVGNLIHVDMQGGVNDNVTLSAYITAALLEAGNQSTDPIVAKSLEYLRNAYSQVNSTYAIALLSYTFTLAGDQVMRGTLLSRLNQLAIVTVDGRHWSSGSQGMGTNPLDVEMTAYVLLAVLSGPPLASFDLGYSASIVHWLGQQQNSYGGFISTQDTVVALQALAKYSSITYSPTGTITVTVMSTHSLKTQLTVAQFTVNQSNRLLYQQAKLQQVSGVYKVRASGQGCVFVQFTMYYNIPPPNDFSSFDISTSEVGNCSDPIPSLEISVTVTYNGANKVSTMVVIEFKLLSGFSLVKVNGTVKRVDKNDDVVIIYLDGLKKGERQTYTLIIQQDIVVQNLMPAVVKVYDYYKP